MGAFSEIFGHVPRVLVLETLAENPDDELSIRDIIDETEVSKRGVYLIIRSFVKDGLVIESGKWPKKYKLNTEDLRAIVLIRAEPLLIMGKLEYELKLDEHIPPSETYPDSYLYNINSNYYSQFNYKAENSFEININNSSEINDIQDGTASLSNAEPVGA